jgi:hypothetical protein
MTRITRLEVITDTGRDYVCWEDDNDITVSYQDGGRTLKVFVNTMKPKSPAEIAYKRVYGKYPYSDKLRLSLEEQQRFAETLLNPPAPNVKLKKAMSLYFENVVTEDDYGTHYDPSWEHFSSGYEEAQEDYKVGEYQPTSQEPEELKTLYQMFYDENWSSAGCDDICKVVKEWMSQYEINGWEDDWDVGFSDCFYKLNKGLK